MHFFQKIILIGGFTAIFPMSAFAETPQPSPCESADGGFGCFEVGLPGIQEKTIDSFLDHYSKRPILTFIDAAVKVVTAILVIIGVISIVIGGYMYMTAGGDASQLKTAKEWIVAALAGIIISLASVIILNTVNTFLGSKAQEPTLSPLPAAPGGGPPTDGGGSPTNNAPANLPNSATVTLDSVRTEAQNTEDLFTQYNNGRSFDQIDRDLLQQKINTLQNQIVALPNQNSREVTDLLARKQILEENLANLVRVHL